MESVRVEDGVGWVALGDTLVMLWRDPCTRERWQFQIDALHRLTSRCPDGVLCFSLILSSSSPPSRALRVEMRDGFHALGDKLRKLIFVPLGDSIWLSVVRTLVRATFLLSGDSHRQTVGSSLADGLARVRAAASPRTPTDAEILQVVRTMCHGLEVPDLTAEAPSLTA